MQFSEKFRDRLELIKYWFTMSSFMSFNHIVPVIWDEQSLAAFNKAMAEYDERLAAFEQKWYSAK